MQHSPSTSNPHTLYNKLWLTKQVNISSNTVIVFNLIQGNNTFEGVTLIFPHLNLYENKPLNTEDISKRALKREKYVAPKLYVLSDIRNYTSKTWCLPYLRENLKAIGLN